MLCCMLLCCILRCWMLLCCILLCWTCCVASCCAAFCCVAFCYVGCFCAEFCCVAFCSADELHARKPQLTCLRKDIGHHAPEARCGVSWCPVLLPQPCGLWIVVVSKGPATKFLAWRRVILHEAEGISWSPQLHARSCDFIWRKHILQIRRMKSHDIAWPRDHETCACTVFGVPRWVPQTNFWSCFIHPRDDEKLCFTNVWDPKGRFRNQVLEVF